MLKKEKEKSEQTAQTGDKIRQSASTKRQEYSNPAPLRTQILRGTERSSDRFESAKGKAVGREAEYAYNSGKRISQGYEENQIPVLAGQKGKKPYPIAEDKQKNEPFKSRHLQRRIYDEDSYEQGYTAKAQLS